MQETIEGEIVAITRENYEKTRRIDELEARLELKDKLSFVAPYYYAEGDDTPYCPNCYEGQQKAIHLVVYHDTDIDSYLCQCRTCSQSWYRKPEPEI